MIPVPIDLPVRPSEAATLAELVVRHLDLRSLTDDARNRLAGESSTMGFSSLKPHFGSLEADPIHNSVYYLAVDGIAQGEAEPLLLRLAPASSPASALFPGALLIGRMRPGGGREMVVNAIPFSSRDGAALDTYVEKVARVFLPRPQGASPAIAVGNRHPEISLPAAFAGYRSIYRDNGLNMASTVQLSVMDETTTDEAIAERDGEDPVAPGHTRVSIRSLYHAGLWAAVRAGWREGYTAQLGDIVLGGDTADHVAASLDAAREVIRQAGNFSKFSTNTSGLVEVLADVRHPNSWSYGQIHERFGQIFDPSEQTWIRDEFSATFTLGDGAYQYTAEEVERLAVKFERSLRVNEEVYDSIRSIKSLATGNRTFDFEPSIDGIGTLTTPKELLFYMQWLKSRGRPAQLIAVDIGFEKCRPYSGSVEELGVRVRELAAIVRQFNATLSLRSGSGKQAEVLDEIGRATSGRFNYGISGELQLQLFDVLSEQPEESPWRRLYLRMADRAFQFAAQGGFGGCGVEPEASYSLGNGDCGRTDGNRFLIRWLGNVVGTRDTDGVFFKDKLDRLPAELIAEVQRRNTRYITWLASHLR